MTDRRPLAAYAADVTSQFGEDGILAEILDRIAAEVPLAGWCVDVGAADGVWLSNVCTLVRERGFRAVMIEADADRFAALSRNHPGDDVVKVHATVGWEGDARLDRILAPTPVPADFDVCSIDVDGNDHWVLGSLVDHRPKVVVVEFNPTIPNAVDYVQAPDPRVARGASAAAMVRLGRSLGYSPVAATVCNLVLVRDDLVGAVVDDPDVETELDRLRDPAAGLVFAFTGYDGTTVLSAPLHNPWFRTTASVGDLQSVPALLRRYPASWGVLRRTAWRLWRPFPRRLRAVARKVTRTAPVGARGTINRTVAVPVAASAPTVFGRTPRGALAGAVRDLHPRDAGVPLVRLGPDTDGGYLVPDDLDGIVACFSPGVGDATGFDDACAARGMRVFQADGTVADPGRGHHFVDRNLGRADSDTTITLGSWVAQADPGPGDLLLQMDVEGAEYEVLLATPPEVLARFRVIVLELHHLAALGDGAVFRLFRATLDRLLAGHTCVHAHPNNVVPPARVDGIVVPPLLEVTFLRDDRVRGDGFVTEFPHPLDRDNVAGPTVVLPPAFRRVRSDG